MSTPNFDTDLKRGHIGEEFLRGQHRWLGPAPVCERRWDLEGLGRRVEVKTDSYDPTATPNFFMEQRTRVAGKPGEILGGPWRSLSHGVDSFVYLFHDPAAAWVSRAYWFNTEALCAALDELLPTLQVRKVRGGRLTAVGVLVPRKLLRAIGTKVVYTCPTRP